MFPELWLIEFVCSVFLFVSLVPKDKDYEQLEADSTLYPVPRLGKIVVNSSIPRVNNGHKTRTYNIPIG